MEVPMLIRRSVALLFIIILFLAILTGWHIKSENGIKIQTKINNIKLSSLWAKITDYANLQNSTANLEWLHLRVSDGKLQSLHLEFTGEDRQGRSRIYYVDINSLGLINIYSRSIRVVQHTTHPDYIFAELDKLGLEKIGHNFILDADFEWGDLIFNSTCGGLYLLDGGKLVPIKQVTFHTNTPVCRILVCRNSSCEVWFTQEDLLKADDVDGTLSFYSR